MAIGKPIDRPVSVERGTGSPEPAKLGSSSAVREMSAEIPLAASDQILEYARRKPKDQGKGMQDRLLKVCACRNRLTRAIIAVRRIKSIVSAYSLRRKLVTQRKDEPVQAASLGRLGTLESCTADQKEIHVFE